MDENGRDREIRGRGVDGADEPSELDLGHDEPHGLERALGPRAVIQQEQDAADDLDADEGEGDAAPVVPDGVPVDRDGLVGGEIRQRAERVAVPEEGAQPLEDPHRPTTDPRTYLDTTESQNRHRNTEKW